MFKRPLVWVAVILLIGFFTFRFFYGDSIDQKDYILDSCIDDTGQAVGEASGKLARMEQKTAATYYYLDDVTVVLSLSKKKQSFCFSHFLVVQNLSKKQTSDFSSQNFERYDSQKTLQKPKLHIGNIIAVKGKIMPFLTPANPGQYNERQYYREQNIYYKMISSQIIIQKEKTDRYQETLLQLREHMKKVYYQCMDKESAGVVCSMLLGDRSLLDGDIKSLYQVNGIGHILSISGLHISILCLSLYRFLLWIQLPRPFPYLLAIFFLLSYGMLTGFGIATTRAVIMMLLWITARETDRSYDALSALSFGVIFTLLQKPYAVFSASFLLSYTAAFACHITYPALRTLWIGTVKEERAYHRQNLRKRKEWCKNSRFPKTASVLYAVPNKMISAFLFSLSVNLTTLPVAAYFFYEVPTYGILLNLLILPVMSVCLILALLGGVAGLICLPAAALPLQMVEKILQYYKSMCEIFLTFPKPILILGRPQLLSIVLFILFMALILVYLYWTRYAKTEFSRKYKLLTVCFLCLAVFFLNMSTAQPKMMITILDVGQGDGIVLHAKDGTTILIDGGSTDSGKVGKYRITPFLKYYGISRIDYMIMTHADEDHISGQLELMQQQKQNGISIGVLLLPQPEQSCQDENYRNMIQTAQKYRVAIQLIRRGDCFYFADFTLECIHPEKDFLADSANAYSTTLRLICNRFSMLFTGDLEKNGENAVQEELKRISAKCDILKVAHHGSKYASSDAFLDVICPRYACISCGKHNRYGHPHKELLKRLTDRGCSVWQTQERGAICIQTDGNTFCIKGYRNTGKNGLNY